MSKSPKLVPGWRSKDLRPPRAWLEDPHSSPRLGVSARCPTTSSPTRFGADSGGHAALPPPPGSGGDAFGQAGGERGGRRSCTYWAVVVRCCCVWGLARGGTWDPAGSLSAWNYEYYAYLAPSPLFPSHCLWSSSFLKGFCCSVWRRDDSWDSSDCWFLSGSSNNLVI